MIVLLCITLCPFSLCNHLEEKEKVGIFAFLSKKCIATINVLWLYLMVPWIGLQCVIVVFPDHAHLLFEAF